MKFSALPFLHDGIRNNLYVYNKKGFLKKIRYTMKGVPRTGLEFFKEILSVEKI